MASKQKKMDSDLVYYSEQDIYKFVSAYYRGLELSKDQFSNRLFAMKSIVLHGYSMRDAIDFLDMREHWWEYDKEERKAVKSDVRKEFKQILSKMDLELVKGSLKRKI